MIIALTPDLEQKITKKAQELGMTPEHLVFWQRPWIKTMC